jgi:hypothetical protein
MQFVFNLLLQFGLFESDIYVHTILVQISEALKLYTELDKDKKSFTLLPCWNILKEEDKWKAKMVELAELEKQAAAANNGKKEVHQSVSAKGRRRHHQWTRSHRCCCSRNGRKETVGRDKEG